MFRLGERLGRIWIVSSALLSSGLLLLIGGFLAVQSLGGVWTTGWSYLSSNWNPATGQFGMFPMFFGSAMVTLIALVLAVPAGLLTSVWTSEILPVRFRFLFKSFLEILAGIPSIVYGLLGVATLSLLVGDLFHLESGRTIFTAGLLLAVMVLPTIITLCDDALRNVPEAYREAARGLGLYRYEVIAAVVIPQAGRDIAGAVLLGLGRALGETMAVMLVIGGIDRIPEPFFNLLLPGQTVTSKLGRELAEAPFGSLHFDSLVFMGLLLMFGVVTVTILAQTWLTPRKPA